MIKRVGIAAIVIIIAAGIWYFAHGNSVDYSNATHMQTVDNSNTGVASDDAMANIDAQLEAAADANASAQNFNDTPVSQAE